MDQTFEIFFILFKARDSGNAVLQEISRVRKVAGPNLESVETIQPTPSHRADESVVSGVGGLNSPTTNVGPIKLTFSPGQTESDSSNVM